MISKSTRIHFQEACVGLTLRQISMCFEGEEISYDESYDPPVNGERRALVAQYYNTIQFDSARDTKKLCRAYDEIIKIIESEGSDFIGSNDLVDDLIRRMHEDGYTIINGRFSAISPTEIPFMETIKEYIESKNLQGLQTQIDRIEKAVDDDPPLAIGTAKELLETVCKIIMEERNIPVNIEPFPALFRKVTKELKLLPESVPNRTKGTETIRRVLGSFNQVAQGMAELRNLYGTGHGTTGTAGGLLPRHARLAVGAATTLATFLLETHLARLPD